MTIEYQTHLTRGQPDDEAIKLIQYFEPLALEADPRGYCVCTSEGKDSRVLGHLMRRANVKHFYMHNITGIDPPELIYFQRANFQLYRDIGYLTYDVMYEISMWRLCRKKRILPMRTRRFCCEHLKERNTEEAGSAFKCLGVRKAESVRRSQIRDELEIVNGGKRRRNLIMPFDNDENRRTFETCYTNCDKRINPIVYWTDADIWNYTDDVRLEQCSLYFEGFSRLGCIGCPLAREAGRKAEFQRWPGFKKLYIRTAQCIIDDKVRDGLQLFKINNQSVTTGEEYFEWWLLDKYQDIPDENQLLFADYEV